MSEKRSSSKLGLIIAVAVVVAIVFALWPRKPDVPVVETNARPDSGAVEERAAPSDTPPAEADLRLATGPRDAGQADAAAAAAEPKKDEPLSPVDADSPLIGLGTRDVDPNLKSELKLPEKVKGGVIITAVDPASPAVEVGLRPNDIIIRAHHSEVTTFEELQRAIGERDQTMLRVFRNGVPMDVVLMKPFKPK